MTDTSTEAAKAPRYCLDGCGQQVAGKSNYKPGHDAKHVSSLVGVAASENFKVATISRLVKDLPTTNLQEKFKKQIETYKATVEKRAAKAKDLADAKAAKAKAQSVADKAKAQAAKDKAANKPGKAEKNSIAADTAASEAEFAAQQEADAAAADVEFDMAGSPDEF